MNFCSKIITNYELFLKLLLTFGGAKELCKILYYLFCVYCINYFYVC